MAVDRVRIAKRRLAIELPALAIMMGIIFIAQVLLGRERFIALQPYATALWAVYMAYVILRVVLLFRRMPKRVKTPAERRNDVQACLIGLAGLGFFCVAPFQHWMSVDAWALLAGLLVLVALLVPQMIRNKRAYGTWMVKGTRQSRPEGTP